MRVLLHLLATTLFRGLAAAVLGLAAAAVLMRPALPGAGPEAGATVVLWMHLPAALACLASIAHLLETWPTLARGRPGGELVARALSTRLSGAGMAALGALLGLGLVLTGVGAAFPGFARLLGREVPAPREAVGFRVLGPGLLDAERPRLVLRASHATKLAELRLAPLGLFPRDGVVVPARVRVLAGGERGRVLRDALEVGGGSDADAVRFDPVEIEELVLERLPGPGVPLFFPPDAVVGMGADLRSR